MATPVTIDKELALQHIRADIEILGDQSDKAEIKIYTNLLEYGIYLLMALKVITNAETQTLAQEVSQALAKALDTARR